MKENYETLKNLIHYEHKNDAIQFVIELLETKQITIIDLYEQLLNPILNSIDEHQSYDRNCIWHEHVQSAIVRSIVECVYPFVIDKQKESIDQSVIVVCPTEEYHEIGARMAHDFFNLVGLKSTFIGANTPDNTILSAIESIKPDFLAISVTNYYHLTSIKRLINTIKTYQPSIKVIAGGRAIQERNLNDLFQIDYIAQTYEDIKQIVKEKIEWF